MSQAQQLEAEVVRMRSQQDTLRRKMDELADKYEEKNKGQPSGSQQTSMTRRQRTSMRVCATICCPPC